MKHILTVLLSLFLFTQGVHAQEVKDLVHWDVKISKSVKENEYKITATAKLEPQWHVFGKNPGDDFLIPTHFELKGDKTKLISTEEEGSLKTEKMEGVGTIHYYEKQVSFTALVRSLDSEIKGFIEFQICNATMCLPPTEHDFTFKIN